MLSAIGFLGFLLVRQALVISRGLNTNEYLRNIYMRDDGMRNPFNQGNCYLNWLAFFLEPSIKSKNAECVPILDQPYENKIVKQSHVSEQRVLPQPQDSSCSNDISRVHIPFRSKSSCIHERSTNRYLKKERKKGKCCGRLQFESEIIQDYKQKVKEGRYVRQALEHNRSRLKAFHSPLNRERNFEYREGARTHLSRSTSQSRLANIQTKQTPSTQGYLHTSIEASKSKKAIPSLTQVELQGLSRNCQILIQQEDLRSLQTNNEGGEDIPGSDRNFMTKMQPALKETSQLISPRPGEIEKGKQYEAEKSCDIEVSLGGERPSRLASQKSFGMRNIE